MAVSVIIPAWNGRPYLPACLEALLAQAGEPLEVIVVDNASTDGSADLVAGRYPRVRLIRHERNLGFSGGCNAGLTVAAGDILVLLNQDTVVAPDWLTALLSAFENPAIGIAGCKCFYQDGRRLQHAGGCIEWPLGLGHHYGYGEPDGPAWSEPRAVDFVTGAALAMRRAVPDAIGLLDENFWPGYFEDVDYCFRARAHGFGVWYWPAARLIHLETKSSVEQGDLHRYLNQGRMRFVLKHLPPQRWLDEFLPAERAFQQQMAGGELGPILRACYLQIAVIVASLYRALGKGAEAFVEPVTAAFLQLYRDGWQLETNALAGVYAGRTVANATDGSVSRAPVPPLPPARKTFLARLQNAWDQLTGKSAQLRMQRQQRRIDQQQLYVEALNKQLELLSEENASLARFIVQHQSGDPQVVAATDFWLKLDRQLDGTAGRGGEGESS